MNQRIPLKKLSDKRLAELGGRVPFSSIANQSQPLPRGGKPRPVNKKRKAKEFARAYHSVERVEFVKDQPCKACHRLFASENAHVLGNGGAGRKAGYETIAPLCGAVAGTIGCHRMFDEHRSQFDKFFQFFDPAAAAAATQRAWLAFTGGE